MSIITSKQDASQVLRLAFEDSTQSIRVQTGSPNGEPAPASSIPIGAVDPDGNLQPIHVDENGALEVTFAATAEQVVVQPDGTKLHATIDASALPAGASTSALQTSGNASLSSIDTKTPALTSGRVPVDGSGVTQPVSAVSLPLPTGAATSANQSTEITALNNIVTSSGEISTNTMLTAADVASLNTKATAANASLASIDTKLTAPLAVTGPLTDTQLRATAVPVSMAAVATGGATSALQTAGNASLTSIDSKLTSPITVTGALTDTQLRATPVPVSGSVTVTQATGANLHTVVDSSALPTGAATSSNQVTAQASLSSIDTKLTSPLAVTGPLTDTQLRATAVPVSLASVPLATGAATSANQATEIASLSSIDTKTPALGQALAAGSVPVVLPTAQITALTPPTSVSLNAGTNSIGSVTFAAKTVTQLPTYTIYASTPVNITTYVQIVASTAAAITRVSIFDSSGQAMILSTGPAASEVIKLYIPPGGGDFDIAIPISTRIAIKALTGTASSGYQLVNLLT